MGAYLGKSNGCPFTEQADRKLVCLFAKASFYTDRSVGISSHSLGANPPVPSFSCLKTKPVCVASTYAGESTSTPADMRQLLPKDVKNEWKDENKERAAESSPTSRWPRHDPTFYCSNLV